ncbi:diguanylate cyclase domain-containing protein [Cloacibacillus evryensis]|uniref:diguanylate cyclase domain-containing protein n=1 Tax=Cloacibacillus evryensis TaxID=508460 RepID=UPI003A8A9C6E
MCRILRPLFFIQLLFIFHSRADKRDHILCAGGRYLAASMMDIDNFKNYNYFHGHVKGDKCLAAVGRRKVYRLEL